MKNNPVLIACLLLSGGAHAYQLKKDSSGEVVRWSSGAHFILDHRAAELLGDDQAFNAVTAAVEEVRGAAPGLTLTVEAGEVSGVGYDRTPGAENRNEIVVPEDWVYDPSALAVTVVTLNVTRHEIIDADIAFNTEHRRFKVLPEDARAGGEFDDIQNTLTHELGHAVGLAHNPDEPEAVMYPGARRGEISKRSLSEDDVAGLAALYDAGGGPEDDDLQAAGCSAAGAGPGLWVLLLGVPAFALRRRRRLLARGAAAAAVLFSGAALARDDLDLRSADLVATAEVVAARPLPPKEGQKLLFTELEVRVRECIVGACGQTVTVRVPGGRWGDIEQVVEDHPVPRAGEVVALTRDLKEGVALRAPKTVTRLYRLEDAREFVRFARALSDSGLSARLTPGVSPLTSRSLQTPARSP